MSRLTATCIHHRETGDITLTLVGRDAWAAKELVLAGEKGCTPIDNPAPRWSGYILKLRKAGLLVETINEAHTGQFAGSHARYVLRSNITLSGDVIREWCGKYDISGGVPKRDVHEAAA